MTDDPLGIRTAQRTSTNGNKPFFTEAGSPGLETWAGYISEAYQADLQWPTVHRLYNRIRRSDPEIALVRNVFSTLGRAVSIEVELPENPSDDDKRAQEFTYEVLDDLEGGIERWRDTLLSYVPFLGWGWWEIVPALRRSNWRPPNRDDPWRSQYDDGRIGVRRLGWRDQSSFDHWEIDEARGWLKGMWQQDQPNPPVLLPLEYGAHITFGDNENPEGLSPLEAIYRLERIKYQLEIVQGIGFEHTAGYLDVTSEAAQLSTEDDNRIKRAAKSILSLQESNYAAWPKGLKGELKNVDFSAAATILEAIRYYGLLKLQIYFMQGIAVATTAKTGAFSAAESHIETMYDFFNSMVEGFVDQMNEHMIKRLFEWNKLHFPGLTRPPMLSASQVEKSIQLGELSRFIDTFAKYFDVGEDDIIAIRHRSDFLPENLPEDSLAKEPGPEEDVSGAEVDDEEEAAVEEAEEDGENESDEEEEAELAFRPFLVSAGENPINVKPEALIDVDKDVKRAVNKFKKWAEENEPKLAEWLDADVDVEEE